MGMSSRLSTPISLLFLAWWLVGENDGDGLSSLFVEWCVCFWRLSFVSVAVAVNVSGVLAVKVLPGAGGGHLLEGEDGDRHVPGHPGVDGGLPAHQLGEAGERRLCRLPRFSLVPPPEFLGWGCLLPLDVAVVALAVCPEDPVVGLAPQAAADLCLLFL